MPLGIFIQPVPDTPGDHPKQPRSNGTDYEAVCYFDHDGYYWYLYPFLEDLAEQTSQMLDLYGYAEFVGETLDAFAQTLGRARCLAGPQPDAWEIVVGYTMAGVEIRSTVDKQEMLNLLHALERAVRKAKRTGRCITCWGD